VALLLHVKKRKITRVLGRSGRLMSGHLLGVLKPPVVFQVDRNAGCPPGVTADWGEKTREANFADRFGVSRSTLYRIAESRVA
jgi:hypothetical protein